MLKLSNKRRLYFLLFIAVVVAVLSFRFQAWLETHQPHTQQVRSKAKSAVLNNRFYTLEKLLAEYAVTARIATEPISLSQLPTTPAAVVVRDIGVNFSADKLQQMLNFIAHGGRVIVVADTLLPPTSSADEAQDVATAKTGNKLLDYFGVYASNNVDSEFVRQEKNKGNTDYYFSTANFNGQTMQISLPHALHLHQNKTAKNKAQIIAKHKYGATVMAIDWGEGDLIIVTSLSFMHNPNMSELIVENQQSQDNKVRMRASGILNYDHAFFSWQLFKDYRQVIIYPNYDVSNLFDTLWAKARLLVYGLGILLLFALWSMYNRFGPLLPNIEQPRRSLNEHLAMYGNFAWSQDRAKLLLLANRARTEQLLFAKHKKLRKLQRRARLQQFELMFNIPQQQLYNALYKNPLGIADFVSCSYQLQKLRSKL